MKKVLVVDDEPHVTLVLKQFLERSGYSVCTALNGELALVIIEQEKPDLVITDVQMPIMGGIELCEHIRNKYPQFSNLIIIMTSRTDREIRTWADQFETVELMEKPLSMRRLVIRLNEYFD